jgi:hypothetical protein
MPQKGSLLEDNVPYLSKESTSLMLPDYLEYFDSQYSIPTTTYGSQLQPLFAK